MGAANPETPFTPSAPQRMGIPFAVIIVPGLSIKEEMLSDLRKRWLMRIGKIPTWWKLAFGYTQYSPRNAFDREDVWSSVASEIRALRRRSRVLLVKPSLYEETLHERSSTSCRDRAHKDSPAALAECKGDLILSIGGG
jgi:hypothetical protein